MSDTHVRNKKQHDQASQKHNLMSTLEKTPESK